MNKKEREALLHRLPVIFAVLESLGASLWEMGERQYHGVLPQTMFYGSVTKHSAHFCLSILGDSTAFLKEGIKSDLYDEDFKFAAVVMLKTLSQQLDTMLDACSYVVQVEPYKEARSVAGIAAQNVIDASNVVLQLLLDES